MIQDLISEYLDLVKIGNDEQDAVRTLQSQLSVKIREKDQADYEVRERIKELRSLFQTKEYLERRLASVDSDAALELNLKSELPFPDNLDTRTRSELLRRHEVVRQNFLKWRKANLATEGKELRVLLLALPAKLDSFELRLAQRDELIKNIHDLKSSISSYEITDPGSGAREKLAAELKALRERVRLRIEPELWNDFFDWSKKSGFLVLEQNSIESIAASWKKAIISSSRYFELGYNLDSDAVSSLHDDAIMESAFRLFILLKSDLLD